jgi:hypothetical protein
MLDFTARFDLLSYESLAEPDTFSFEAQIVDNSGVFSAKDAQVGSVIYNDCTITMLGVVRFVLTEIDPATDFSTLKGTMKLDMGGEKLKGDYPVAYQEGLIGSAGELGTLAVASMALQTLDESFIAAVRNNENRRLAKMLLLSNPSLKTNTPVALQPLLPVPTSDDQILLGDPDGTDKWVSNVDLGEFN